MSQSLEGRYSVYATAFMHTILPRPDPYFNKLFISAVKPYVPALDGRYGVRAMAYVRTILSLPEPHPTPPIYTVPLFSILDFSTL